ncbi:GntR family transcriptional regulator [Bradyrhizobium sp. SSUT18]|uniref:GntR family transcriptional regulator n=1 Tax=Bradyrhizobium sp. SSUT18 TaxID=3040602 RepID=UPI00244B0AA5|nr:GntR family transcriptional regulator [Bradyrhizobium sp. SSUT18]MDH2406634.1 GntR family transcriptional regulator [Bradyrhizobium sp. SSUT18]
MSSVVPLRDERTLVLQLRDAISAMIEERKLQPGDQLPTESELTQAFRISRPALREALKLLEQDGTIYVKHGKGRFVSAMGTLQVERPITCFESVTDMVRRFGYKPTNKVLSVLEQDPSEEVQAALRLNARARVIRLERLRMHGKEVLVYCVDYIPRPIIPDHVSDIDWSGSVLNLLERYRQRPSMSTASASAVLLPQKVSDRNNLSDFGPAFLVTEVAYTRIGTPVLFSKDYHRGSRFTFSFVRK